MTTNIQSEVNTNRSYARVWETLLHLHNLEPSVLGRTSDRSLRKNVASKERVLKKKKVVAAFYGICILSSPKHHQQQQQQNHTANSHL